MIEATYSDNFNLMTLEYRGEITLEDYDEVLKPMVKALSQQDKKPRLIVDVTKLKSATLDAIREDSELGFDYMSKFDRVSVLARKGAVSEVSDLSPNIIRKVKVFSPEEIDDALRWAL